MSFIFDNEESEEAYINAEFVDIVTNERWDFPTPFVMERPEFDDQTQYDYYAPPPTNQTFFIMWQADSNFMEDLFKNINKMKDDDNGEFFNE